MVTYEAFKTRLMDPSVPAEEIAPYLTVDRGRSGPFDPRVVPDPALVPLDAEGQFDVEAGLRWANAAERWRRQQQFEARLTAGEESPVLVSEGDSWFQFPFLLEDVVDHLGADHLVWSLDAAGDTAENMVNRQPEYLEGLRAQKANDVAAFLFSAAGNDVIGTDENGESVLTRLVKRSEPGRDAAWHVDHAELGKVMVFLDTAYRRVLATIRADPDLAALPVLLHGYDYPLPGGFPDDPRRPAWAAPDRWLGAPLRERGIEDPALQRAVMRLLIDATYDMLHRLAGDSTSTRVHVVDVRGTLPEVSDWADEIHPTDEGFGRVAARFRDVLRSAGIGSSG